MASQPATSRGTKSSVLVVEPDEVLRQILQLTLEDDGYRVHSAATAYDAIRLNGEVQVHAVVVNWLAGLHPASLITALRQKQPDLPAIIVTADGRSTAECEAISDGEVLEMPFWGDEFLASVKRIVLRSDSRLALAAA